MSKAYRNVQLTREEVEEWIEKDFWPQDPERLARAYLALLNERDQLQKQADDIREVINGRRLPDVDLSRDAAFLAIILDAAFSTNAELRALKSAYESLLDERDRLRETFKGDVSWSRRSRRFVVEEDS